MPRIYSIGAAAPGRDAPPTNDDAQNRANGLGTKGQRERQDSRQHSVGTASAQRIERLAFASCHCRAQTVICITCMRFGRIWRDVSARAALRQRHQQFAQVPHG